MKILQVVPYFYPAWAYGGIVRVAYELSRELVRSGHAVTVFTTDAYDEKSRLPGAPAQRNRCGLVEAEVEGISVYYFKNLCNNLAYRHQFFTPYGMPPYLGRKVGAFDIIQMHGHRHLLNSTTHWNARRSRIPYIFTAHGTLPRIERRIFSKRLFDALLCNSVLRDAAHFTAVSRAEVRQYEAAGIAPERVTVTYNGLDLDGWSNLPQRGVWRRRHNVGDRDRLILYLGKITQRKGLDILLAAFSGIEDEGWRLQIAGGDHGWGTQLKAHVKALPQDVRRRVATIGRIGEEEKRQALVDADVVVYPSTLEVFGLVPFEAILCGTPVVVTDDSGCGEIIGEAEAGRVVSYGDPDALRTAIIETAADRDGSALMVERGRAYIREHLSWPAVASRVIGVYEKVLSC